MEINQISLINIHKNFIKIKFKQKKKKIYIQNQNELI